MLGKIPLGLSFLALGVVSFPTLLHDASAAQSLDRRDVPMCGAATGISCGMSLCCSSSNYCGTSPAHCTAGGCQSAFGSCSIPVPKRCGTTSGTVNGRTVGYYRGASATRRNCHVIQPIDIDTSKYTHLNYAFATFDASFKIQPKEAADEPLYRKFTSLKSAKLETWIALGGGITNTPWSAMVASSGSRATFISSLTTFLSTYGFQGVDLDWEVPQSAADKAGYLALVKEMKTKFAGAYKISIAFPPDVGDMFWIDAKGMEPYVDFIGFMSYSYRNSAGTVASHTNIITTEARALPLWFAGLSPAKLNLGLASYGQSFTLSDTACAEPGCAVKGIGKAGTCIVDNSGVMALFDIKDLITSKQLIPKLNTAGMFKQITFDDQWIGYDDAETIALKKTWGNDFCFGGTMLWTIDLGDF